MGLFQSIARLFGSRPRKPATAAGQPMHEGYAERMRRWESAQTNRLNAAHWEGAAGQPINADLASWQSRLRERSEYEIANNPMIQGMISTYTLSLIGSDGPTLQIVSDDPRYNQAREQIWSRWARHAASNQQLGLVDIMRLWVRSLFAGGEFIDQLITVPEADGPVKMRLLPIHSRRLLTPPQQLGVPEVAMGVRRDLRNRRPISYYISQPQIQGSFELHTGEFLEIEYRDLLHGFLMVEEDQVRGVPWLSPCLDAVAELRDYKVSTLDAARAAADWGVYFYTDNPDIPPIASAAQPMSQTFERRQERNLPPSWKVQQVTAQQPPANWETFYHSLVREIGRCVDMPLMMLLLDSSRSNYSSARFDGQLFWRGIGYTQGFLGRHLDRLEREVSDEAELAYLSGDRDGLPPPPGRVERKWLWPKAPHIDPTKEAQAERIRLQNGELTYSELCAAHNKQVEDVIAQRRTDNKRLKKAGLPIIPGIPDANPNAPAPAGQPGQPGPGAPGGFPGAGGAPGAPNHPGNPAGPSKVGPGGPNGQSNGKPGGRSDPQEGLGRFNPNHDEKGQFTDDSGAATGGGGLSGGHDKPKAEVGKPSLDQKKTAVKLVKRVKARGGFTYHAVSHTEPTRGFVVSVHPERSVSIPLDKLRPAHLSRYVAKNADLLARPGNFLGAWLNSRDNRVYLDVSTVANNRSQAFDLGAKHDQIAAWDLKHKVEIEINAAATSGGAARHAHGEYDHEEETEQEAGPPQSEGGSRGNDPGNVPATHRPGGDGGGNRGVAGIAEGAAGRVARENPYHDEAGKFTSEDSAASGTGGDKPASGKPAGAGEKSAAEAKSAKCEAARKAVMDRVERDLKGAFDPLSAEQSESYRAAASRAMERIPPVGLNRIQANLEGIDFYKDTMQLSRELAARGRLAGNERIGGAWEKEPSKPQGRLKLDGGNDSGDDFNMRTAHVYAHEFGHVVDETPRKFSGSSWEGGGRLSDSAEWKAVFGKEIDVAGEPLSHYARTSHNEGFAEFCRLAYTDPGAAKDSFPDSWSFLDKHELAPAVESSSSGRSQPNRDEKGQFAAVDSGDGGKSQPAPAAGGTAVESKGPPVVLPASKSGGRGGKRGGKKSRGSKGKKGRGVKRPKPRKIPRRPRKPRPSTQPRRRSDHQ